MEPKIKNLRLYQKAKKMGSKTHQNLIGEGVGLKNKNHKEYKPFDSYI